MLQPTMIRAPRQQSAVLKWILADLLSKSALTILSTNADQILEIGTVLAKRSINAAVGQTVMAAAAGNAGNGVATIDAATPVLAGAQLGVYRVLCIAAGANAGLFAVYDPQGVFIGLHTVGGAAFAKQIKFAIADGGADFVVGDSFTVTTVAGDGKYVPLDVAGVGGAENAAAVLIDRAVVPATVDTDAAGLTSFGVVVTEGLIWPAGITNNQKAAALAQLAALNIVARAQD